MNISYRFSRVFMSINTMVRNQVPQANNEKVCYRGRACGLEVQTARTRGVIRHLSRPATLTCVAVLEGQDSVRGSVVDPSWLKRQNRQLIP